MPTTSYTSLAAAADLRQRRMDAAARHRQVRMAKASRRGAREPRGEPTRILFRLYHLPRWLVTQSRLDCQL